MRAFLAALCALGVLLAAAPAGATAPSRPARARISQVSSAQRQLDDALNGSIATAGSGAVGAYVVDLNTGQPLFADDSDLILSPASVEKIYTTSTALLRFGANATLTTSVLGTGVRGPLGTWWGTLYLRGGGDPTFGSASFDRYWYGTGATVQQLVASLLHNTGIKAVRGRIIGDESYFDSLRGTPYSGYQPDIETEGELSALAYDAGFSDFDQTYLQANPPVFAAQQFAQALSAAKVSFPRRTPISRGTTPAGARLLATVSSPPMSTLIKLTNTPSDNFFAEMLLKGLGARFGGAGTTAAGVAVVRDEVASVFGIHPEIVDGSGLSHSDHTTAQQVVSVLQQLAGNRTFVDSLAVAGETGTLQTLMRGTIAQGRCEGKTGTLDNVANLAGYCHARDGHTLVFAFLMSDASNTNYTHEAEGNMAVSLANYDG